MKKVFTLILSIIYITASSGVVLNVHYCMGKVASVKMDNFKSNVCKCGASSSKGGCCHSEVKLIKLHNDHKQTIASVQFNNLAVALPEYHCYKDHSHYAAAVHCSPLAMAPQLISSPPLYILNNVFRI